MFEEIRKVKPPKLFVIADGPCEHKPDEAKQCATAHEIIDRVDWNCEVICDNCLIMTKKEFRGLHES